MTSTIASAMSTHLQSWIMRKRKCFRGLRHLAQAKKAHPPSECFLELVQRLSSEPHSIALQYLRMSLCHEPTATRDLMTGYYSEVHIDVRRSSPRLCCHAPRLTVSEKLELEDSIFQLQDFDHKTADQGCVAQNTVECGTVTRSVWMDAQS